MAIRFLAAASALALLGTASASTPSGSPVLAGASNGERLILDRVPFNIAVEAIMRRVSDLPFLLCDVALADKRLISLRLEPHQLSIGVVRQSFAAYGYSVTNRGGVLHVCDVSNRSPVSSAGLSAKPKPEFQVETSSPSRAGRAPLPMVPASYEPLAAVGPTMPLGSPLMQNEAVPVPVSREAPIGFAPVPSALVGYRPDYVSPVALLSALQPVFPNLKFSTVMGDGQRPAIFASGPVEDVDRFEKMAKYLDRAPEAIEVQAIVLEVSNGNRSGFGVSMVLNALRSGVGFNVQSSGEGNQLTFRSGSFDGVLSAVSGSSSVRVVSSPRLRGRSGEKMRLQVGSDVPTLGAVVENPSGSTSQTVQYRASGVIFEVTGQVYGRRISLAVHQELSAFAQTETGVRGSPTLSTRALDTVLDLESGEWAVIGGLSASQDSLERESLFGIVPVGRVKDKRGSELVLLITVRRVSDGASSVASIDQVTPQ